MRILGIDPGYAILGYALIEHINNKTKVIEYGVIETNNKISFQERLIRIHNDLSEIIKRLKPNLVAMEELFFKQNVTTAIATAEARGAIILSCALHKLLVFEYTPMQVKLALTGYGKADKKQMQFMTKTLLNLKEIPKPDDAADALAIALCQAHTGIKKENLVASGYQKQASKSLRESLSRKKIYRQTENKKKLF